MPLSYADLVQSTHHHVLALRIGGVLLHLAAEALVIASEDGDLQVLAGLVERDGWTEGLDLISTEPPEQSISIELRVPELDVAALVAAGHDLGGATAELSRWVEGTPWEERQVLLVARVSEPMYGAVGEPVTFSVELDPYSDRATMPDAEAIVSPVRWPSAPEVSHGELYPMVFGAPGALGSSRVPAAPAVIVDTDVDGAGDRRLLIADGPVVADQVSVTRDDLPGAWTVADVEQVRDQDGRGRVVSTVVLAGEGPDDGYWVAWHDSLGPQGGMPGRRRDDVLTTAGELLDYLLDRTTLSVDQGRMDAAAARLETYRVAGFVDQRCGVWEWLRANLLPILPVGIARSPAGLYPVVWRWQATELDAVEHLSADRLEVHRVEPVRYTNIADVANEIVLDWAYDVRTQRYRRRTIATGRDVEREALVPGGAWEATERRGEFTSHALRVSHQRYGLLTRDTIVTSIVYDAPTAGAILAWRAAYHALPARMLEYEGGRELLHLELGDVVTLTDSEMHLQRQVCVVTEVSDPGTGRVGLTLRTIEDPSRVA